MRSIIIKTLKIACGIVVGIVVLLGGATLLLNTKSVQNKMLKKATELLTEKLQTTVGIDSISVNLFAQEIRLYGISVEDQQQRKMLQLKKLAVDLSLNKLLQNEIRVKKAEISGLDALLLKPSKEEPANYQFILDAFKKEKKDSTAIQQPESNKKSPMILDVSNAKLSDIHIKYNDNDITLLQAKYEKRWLSHPTISIQQLRFITDNHKPRKNTGKPKRGFFDAGHLDITTNLEIVIDSMGNDGLMARLTQCTARDSVSGIDIRDLRADVRADKNKVRLREVVVQQKGTILNIDEGELTLPNKREGRALSFTTGTIRGKALLKDISRLFAPVLANFTLPLNLSVQASGNDSTIAFRNIRVTTDDKKLSIQANGDISHLKDKEKLDIRFNVSKMTAAGDIKQRIINQFPVKKLMMKQLNNLGNISYAGQFAVLWKREVFQGVLRTAGGPLNFRFTLDENNKYIIGNASSKAFDIGKVMDMKDIGKIAANADFKIDISKPRTAKMRQQKGGELPIGSVSAQVEDCSYKKIHVRNLSANIKSDGAVASGDIVQRGMRRDLFCSFSFTNTDEMQKIKITKPGIKFHKISDEDRQARDQRRELKKQEKAQEKAQRKEGKTKAKALLEKLKLKKS